MQIRKLVPALTIVHNATFDNIADILALYEEHFSIKYNVINLSATSKRYHRNFEESTRVELDDYFNAQTKNSDYLQVDESSFSEEHIYYQEEGFTGFSDYLSIGEEYKLNTLFPIPMTTHRILQENLQKH